ncbi:Lysine-specific demethylase 7A [Coelomomyces lativittatus]|nr:Lysine-specific demethylase 7A [Coelomomyces lativittatus]
MSESDSASLSSLEDVKTCGICQKTVPKYKYYRWIRCINCLDWYHSKCARVALKDAKQPFDYRCVLCVSVSLINEAERKKIKMIEPFQHLDDLSLSWHIMLNDPSRKIIARDLPFQYVSGHQVTFNWIRETHFLRPFIVSDSAGLEMRLPENLTPDLLTECIGPSFQIDVIDVGMQSDEVWTLQKWLKYFTSPRKTKLYNLLSLEISRTPLSTHFQRPRVVREMDMTDLVWPTARKEKGEFPFVQNYILMSVAGCYTDFHIDFGGSSVFYHVIKGQKIFYLIEPSQKNIELYNAFLSVHTPRFSFLGDRVKRCYQLIVQQNETVFIPSGWIHAVYTPVDSIVFGGNFLHLSATYMQLQMAELECKNEIAFKFQFVC